MRIFASAAQDLGGALAYAEHIFNSSGPVKLMTAHKSKGLEFDHVFILDRDLIRTDKHQQEKNLLYVAQSRAKRTLTYITTEGFEDEAS
jgi:ATP-dependent exoDNAse (exonuclease V) beta subunit